MEKIAAIRTGYAALLFAFASIDTASANPVITVFDVPGSASTYPTAIAGNRIAGWYSDGAGSSHGFLRKANGQIVPFDVSGATNTLAICINAAGEIAGIYTNADNSQHGFIRDPGGTITPSIRRIPTDSSKSAALMAAARFPATTATTMAAQNSLSAILQATSRRLSAPNPPTSDMPVASTTPGTWWARLKR